MADFLMPSLGADMDAGVLLEWYVKPGDAVKRGDIVALVDTDKAAIEIEIFEDGVVAELLIPPGEKVPVGTTLATIQAPGAAVAAPEEAKPVPAEPVPAAPPVETAPSPPPPEPKAPPPAAAAPAPERHHATPAARHHALELGIDLDALVGSGKNGVITKADVDKAAAAPTAAPAEPGERLRVTPLARRLAGEAGIDLSTVVASGADGAITAADVERAAGGTGQSAPAPAAPVEAPQAPKTAKAPKAPKAYADRYAGMRRAIAAALGKSKREIPHYYLTSQIDLSRALGWLEEENVERPITQRIVPAVLLLKASALACRDQPELNGFWVDDGFQPSEAVHLGVGISLRQGGLIAPAIHAADTKDLDTLMADLRDLVKRARKLQLRSSEMSEATITVTNLGDQGVESVYGIIYPPQVALVGFGRVLERPWAENGMLAVRPLVQVTLAADHRASDGHRGGLYLAAIDRYLQTPEAL